MNLKTAKTYVYIDVSNIRYACNRSCNFNLDFVRLYSYFKRKYTNLCEVRYYEGISSSDAAKERHFNFLRQVGYLVCPLERKGYKESAKFTKFQCENCNHLNTVQILPESTKLKSNVDVYLASNMIEQVAKNTEPIHAILVSCDGDYAEAIHTIMHLEPRTFVTVLATPMTAKNNCLSSRLKSLRADFPTSVDISSIAKIEKYVSQPYPKN